MLLVALVGYGSFILHNIGVSNLNFPIIKPWGIGPSSVFAVPIGLVLALLLIPLSAYTLVAKVDRIKHILVTDKTDTTYIWESALGLIFTVVWPLTKILVKYIQNSTQPKSNLHRNLDIFTSESSDIPAMMYINIFIKSN